MKWHRVRGVFLRYFYVQLKGGMSLTDMFYWPFVDILLWGLTASWIQHQSGAVSDLPLLLITGLIFWQVTWRGAIDISAHLLMEFWHRNLVNLFSSPLKISEWTAGLILLNLGKLMISVAFGGLVVYLLYALNVFTVGWAFLPFAITLLIFGWMVGFLAASAIIYWGHQVEMVAWMLPFVFAPFSAVFYPVSTLPGWAQLISWALPTTYTFEGMREILANGQFSLGYFTLSLVLDLVYLALAMRLFRFAFQKSRSKGLARLT
jgi:ABC-2 type transport system permease protein